ncbi:hypothetical protein BCR35DRAFT_307506 [Leucosporidium creatinivorum]|uniref:rRNA-processing protein EFG1 n=1 Tax=Leucosporidium creatinivorum TaxID=106004 RepID=A0A1Y2EMD0_9BASI|nr:hypothetical protein BCR35DRAFT_307506 [Leucosporidium creatinivorum]
MHPDRQAHVLNPREPSTRGSARGRGRGGSRGGRGTSNASQGLPSEIPSGSISKLKAQLRQTKRLLARDDLTPDVRTTSERRQKTLEQELVKAEQSALEQKMVTRYRGVRFFERQKLLRKIKQAKKALEALPEDESHKSNLLDARVDLYYVLRYPKTQKYIALFPSGTYIPFSPAPPAETPPSDALSKRHALRSSIRKKVESGELPAEPESGELGIEGEEDVPAGSADVEGEEEEGKGKRKREHEEQRPGKKTKAAATAPPKVLASASAPKPTPKPTPSAAAPAPSTDSAPAPRPSGILTKKEKKDKKDAKRRANKEAAEAKKAAAVGGEEEEAAGEVAVAVGEQAEGEDKEGWAGEDDFFA